MTNQNNNSEDRQIRKLFKDIKIEANKNLKYRIMQQIDTESILAKERKPTSISSIKSIIVILCIVVVTLVLGTAFAYLGFEMKGFSSNNLFFNYIIPICSILSFIAFIFALDTKIRYKKSQKHIHPKD